MTTHEEFSSGSWNAQPTTPEETAVTPTAPVDSRRLRRNVLGIISLQSTIAFLLLGLATGYGYTHNVPLGARFLNSAAPDNTLSIAQFNFIGISEAFPEPSFLAIIMEVFVWSLAGVLARHEYNLTLDIGQADKFDFLHRVSCIIGESAMGVSIAIGVVAFLINLEFLNISLSGASIGTIAAISFLLGFYHEAARQALEGIQKTVTRVTDDITESA